MRGSKKLITTYMSILGCCAMNECIQLSNQINTVCLQMPPKREGMIHKREGIVQFFKLIHISSKKPIEYCFMLSGANNRSRVSIVAHNQSVFSGSSIVVLYKVQYFFLQLATGFIWEVFHKLYSQNSLQLYMIIPAKYLLRFARYATYFYVHVSCHRVLFIMQNQSKICAYFS